MPNQVRPKNSRKKSLQGAVKGNTKKVVEVKKTKHPPVGSVDKKTGRKYGKNGVLVPIGKPFSKTNQPDPNTIKLAWNKKKALKDLLNITTIGKFSKDKNDYRKMCSDFMGIPEEEVTIKMIMEFRQIEKAIKSKDTFAFNAIMDRGFGKPKQEIEANGNLGQQRPNMTDAQFKEFLKQAREAKTSTSE